VASPFSGVVIAAGVALTSPTLYGALVVGTVPVEDALLRLVVVVAVTTVAVTLVEWVFHGTSATTTSPQDAAHRPGSAGSPGAAADAAASTTAGTTSTNGTAD
jgi:hypothetical protein